MATCISSASTWKGLKTKCCGPLILHEYRWICSWWRVGIACVEKTAHPAINHGQSCSEMDFCCLRASYEGPTCMYIRIRGFEPLWSSNFVTGTSLLRAHCQPNSQVALALSSSARPDFCLFFTTGGKVHYLVISDCTEDHRNRRIYCVPDVPATFTTVMMTSDGSLEWNYPRWIFIANGTRLPSNQRALFSPITSNTLFSDLVWNLCFC
jgi:hypothetical protein